MDERLNGSGVKDLTAYNAIIRAEGRDDNGDVYPGDVWTSENSSGFERDVFILAVNGNIVTVLGLIPDCDCENRVAVEVDGRTLVSNLAMMQYAYTSSLKKHLGQVSADRLGKIKGRLAAVLGLPQVINTVTDDDENRIAELEAELADMQEKYAKKVCECTSIECKRDVKKEAEERMRREFAIEERDCEIKLLKLRIEALQERIIDAEMQRL